MHSRMLGRGRHVVGRYPDLTGIANAERLREMTIEGRGIGSLAGLEAMRSVKVLTLLDLGPMDLSPLRALARLKDLTIDDVRGPVDYTPLASLTGLRRLLLSVNETADALSITRVAFRQLTELRELSIHSEAFQAPRFDLGWLAHTPRIKALGVTGFELGEQAFEQLANVRSLKWINVSIRSWDELERLRARRPDTTVIGSLLETTQPISGSPREMTPGRTRAYGMFTDDGDVAVQRMVSTLVAAVGSGEISDRVDFDERLESAMDDIDGRGHREIFDTDVREQLAAALRPILRRAGIDSEDITAA